MAGHTSANGSVRFIDRGEPGCPLCVHTLPGKGWCTGLCRCSTLEAVAELDRLSLGKAMLAPVPQVQ